MSLKDDPAYRDLATVLNTTWSRVNWSKMGLSKTRRSTDVFQHRLKKASYCNNLKQALEKLCKGLSLQSLSFPIEVLERLLRDEERIMHILRTESVVLTLLAREGPEAIDKL